MIGQDWGQGDVRVVLFVRLRDGLALDDALVERIRSRSATTPRRATCRRRSCRWPTSRARKSGKIVELAVRDVVHGRPVKNIEALANPEGWRSIATAPS